MSKILLVDDDPLSLDLLAQELGDAGYEASLASGGEDALNILAGDRMDLVLLDIMMPRISGIDVLKSIRSTRSLVDLPVIMVTAKDHSADIVQSLSLGANDYVTKPIDLPVLLARIKAQLHLKQLSDLKDEFLQMATHDLNAPLMAIIAGASLLAESVPAGEIMTEEMHGVVSRIINRASNMHRIVADFLDLSAIQDGRIKLNPVPTDLNEIAGEVIEDEKDRAASKGIDLILELEPRLPNVAADAGHIKQVIQNMVNNAVKFCPSGSRAVIRTWAEKGTAFLEVADSGPGLSQEDMENAFSKNVHLSSAPTGGERSFGLGLTICKRLIELHGGEIGVGASPEGGCSFWFSLRAQE